MKSQKPVCNIDDTWEDVLPVFKESLKGQSTWSCFCLDGVDKEVILSAPEIMDPKTDAGFGYAEIRSLQALLDSKEIPSAATIVSEKQLIDAMDMIHVKELTYLQGYSILQSYLPFPYFLRMDLLKEQNPTLHAYCRGVLRSVDAVLRAVYATSIRSEEEFSMVPAEVDRQLECTVEEILAELEAAAAKATPAVAARLRWRKHFLSALTLFLEAKRKSDVEAACGLCEDAVALLKSDVYQRKAKDDEPTIDASMFRAKEMPLWVSGTIPTQPQPTTLFVEAMAAYTTMLTQLASLKTLFSIPTLNGIVAFVENLGAQQPLLPIRSIAVVVLFTRDPNECFLYGLPLHQRLLESMAKEYGAPLYLKIFEGDDASVESVIKYRVQKTMDPLKVTPEQTMFLRQQTTDAVRRWVSELCKHFLVHLEMMLCNRGLAHRRLMNALEGLAQFQEMSYSTDMSVFLATVPGVTADVETECIKATTVLTLVANAYVLRAMELIVLFQFELDLLSQGEVVPALWYLNFAQRAQTENLSMLCLQNTSFIPETRINKRTHVPLHNLALTTRVAGNLDIAKASLLDASRMLSDAIFLSACLMENEGLIDLTSGPKYSLVSVENVFNNRMFKCFGKIHSPPFTPYARCMSAKPDLSADSSKIPVYAKKAGEVANTVAEKARAVLASSSIDETRRASLRVTLEGIEKTAKAVAASLATFATVCEDKETMTTYEVTLERPVMKSLVVCSIHKKN